MTLSELKRTCDQYIWTMTWHLFQATMRLNLVGAPRKIKKKQTNAVQFEPLPTQNENQGSWLQWGKAADYEIAGMGAIKYVTVKETGKDIIKYELVPIPKEVTACSP